jgi:hypothetical protein
MRMEEWELAWMNCQPMPPPVLAPELLVVAQEEAEAWLFDARFRCILEEWIPRQAADEVMGGLLWSGFCLRDQLENRVRPVPVLVRLLYTMPLPMDAAQTRERMRAFFTTAVREWCQAFQQHQQSLRVAP